VAPATTNPTHPLEEWALKEWAVIVHALLEGEQIVDLRKGGLREDGRHFDVPAKRFWLYPTAEHQRAELLKSAYRHWIEISDAAPVGSDIPLHAWADVVDIAGIRGSNSHRLKLALFSPPQRTADAAGPAAEIICNLAQ
jgi:hypothetical protein